MNRLGDQTSPYLRQHADNPVHWQPWSAEALTEARKLDRPILLSIGYAACHWCHVMAHESFEDAETAALMNDLYINIKVDREERPDIDQIYMAALNATGEQGGWPLTMFLTPDARPFWGGTYFPPKAAYGRPSFRDVLRAVHNAWTSQRPQLLNSAEALSSHVAQRLAPKSAPSTISRTPLTSLAEQVSKLIDPDLGGLRGAPKFPNAPFMDALWIDSLFSGDPFHRDQVIDSLRKMLAGGIYDHVGGGLCRYSTDAHWIIPHFEKMLYDNAQLVRHCCLAFAATGDPVFSEATERTLGWIDRELGSERGGFASSLDADSEGEEGKFYTWSEDKIAAILGSDTEPFFHDYALAKPQNWEGDPVIIRRPDSRSGTESTARLERLDRLRVVRDRRPRPTRDDKVLTDWNGLAIRAFAEAGRLLVRQDWTERAATAFRSISESTDESGRLPHSALGSHRLFPALSSDYAAMINAAVALMEATGDRSYLEKAVLWAGLLEAWYGDGAGGYFLTASDAADSPLRIRGDVDDPVPSATAQIIDALTRLSSAAGDVDLFIRARTAAELALGRAESQIYGQAGIYTAAAMAMEPLKLVIAEPDSDTSLSEETRRRPDPRRVDVIVRYSKDSKPANLPQGFDADLASAAWLCTGAICLAPIRDAANLARALDGQTN